MINELFEFTKFIGLIALIMLIIYFMVSIIQLCIEKSVEHKNRMKQLKDWNVFSEQMKNDFLNSLEQETKPKKTRKSKKD